MNQVSLSTFDSSQWYVSKIASGIICYDQVLILARSSIVDSIYFLSGNCSAYFWSSEIETFEVIFDDHSEIEIFDSTFETLSTWSDSSTSIWLENCTIETLVIRGNSHVWLHNSLVVEDYYLRGDYVFAVWDLPFIGHLSVPFLWAPFIIPIIVTIIGSVVILLFVIKYLRAKRKSMVDIQEPV